ncbi:MAG TPA: serine/threonine-protein kinase [Polyangiaceae bacterium]
MGSPSSICTICGARYEAGALFCPRDGAPLGAAAPKGADPFLGIELLGQIRIEQLIGIGSMGRVYRAFQAGVQRRVAVKILHGELSGDATLVARFHREAQIASLLLHPNVVQVFMAGQLPDGVPGAGAMYIVMEYLDGISLRSALAAAGGALPLPRALRIVLPICEALGEAHNQGVVHRDLKPENVMLMRRGTESDFVKVLDFGIARLHGSNVAAVTQAGLIFGTARYVSPEGALGNPVGPPADVYAIATILYQMLAGRTPFEGDSAVGLLAQQINDAPPPIRSLSRASYVPEALASVIMASLAKRPEDRCPDARSLGRALAAAARASGLVPEELVPRSAVLGAPAPHAAFTSVERTKQQDFTANVAQKIAAANPIDDSAGQTVDNEAADRGPPSGPARKSSRGALAFVIGCVVGGAALAALGALRVSEPSSPENVSAPPSIPEQGSLVHDAGPEVQ